ncbi:hypothetical protein [Plantactinospora sp. B24E8]|uniref:hypothetical protein n=1 Tax=Plantactinospora sp. B24E8 TaxID=3153567 RepID=UPI00325D7437
MDRDLFAARLAESAEAARSFAQTLVVERLPAPLVFRVRLNQSYDGHPPRPGEVRYPQDSEPDRRNALWRCDAGTVVDELWRDGRVPEWVNVAVVGETGTATIIELVCCGRFTDDESRLYHIREGVPPFHVLGPALPPVHDGSPFSLHTRTECGDSEDLRHLASVADRIWSVTVAGDGYDHDALPPLPHAEIVECGRCRSGVGALSTFARFPKLRLLRLHLATPSEFQVSPADRLDTLTELTVTGLPPRPWGQAAIAEVAPGLTRVDLAAAETLWLDGAFGPSVRNVELVAPAIAGSARLPTELDHLRIRLGHDADQQVVALLEGVTRLGSLDLRGTPVSDAVLPVLARYDLRQLTLVDTAVSASALSRYRTDHAETMLYPREPAYSVNDLRIVGSPYAQP